VLPCGTRTEHDSTSPLPAAKRHPARTCGPRGWLGDVQREFAIVDVDPRVAQLFGELRARSGRRAVADLLIAATALANGMLLVTRDERQARLLGDQALLAV